MPRRADLLQEYGPVVQIQMGSLAALVVSEEKDRKEMLLTKVRPAGREIAGSYFSFLSECTFKMQCILPKMLVARYYLV